MHELWTVLQVRRVYDSTIIERKSQQSDIPPIKKHLIDENSLLTQRSLWPKQIQGGKLSAPGIPRLSLIQGLTRHNPT